MLDLDHHRSPKVHLKPLGLEATPPIPTQPCGLWTKSRLRMKPPLCDGHSR